MRKTRKEPKQPPQQIFNLEQISPLTKNQEKAFDAWDDGKNLFFHGWPGTGKSFCAMYLALEEYQDTKTYKRIIIVRSAVPGRDMGFLPGDLQEKTQIFEAPYKQICNKLYRRDDAYDTMKLRGAIEFCTTSFLRSITWEDAIVIFDECQNCLDIEIHTVLSRIGDNCRLIICGDYSQIDLKRYEESGVERLIKVIDNMVSFEKIEMEVYDIVRSGFAKEYIIARNSI